MISIKPIKLHRGHIPHNKQQTFLKRNKSRKFLPPKTVKNIAMNINEYKTSGTGLTASVRAVRQLASHSSELHRSEWTPTLTLPKKE